MGKRKVNNKLAHQASLKSKTKREQAAIARAKKGPSAGAKLHEKMHGRKTSS